LLADMEAKRKKQETVPVGNHRYRVTYVAPTPGYQVNEDGLKKAIGSKRYKKVTVTRLSVPMLEEALEQGDISAEEVSPYVSEKPRTPYLRVSMVREREA
jgi:hypothetical protein